jgi:hypothetical protein
MKWIFHFDPGVHHSEVLDQYCRSAVPGANRGEKLSRPASALTYIRVGDAAPAIRLFAMIGLILTMVFPRPLLKSKFNISTQD